MHRSGNTQERALRAQALYAFACHNDRKAFRLWKRLARAGDGEAARRVGSMYHNGEGVKRSLTLAVKWYERAVELGYEPTLPTPKLLTVNMSIENERRGELDVPILPTGDMAIETTVADGAVEPSRDSRERSELAMVLGGLITSAVVVGGILGWLFIGSSDRTPQLTRAEHNDEAGAIPPSIVPDQASRSEVRPEEPVAGTWILGQEFAVRDGAPEPTGISSRVRNVAEADPSRPPRTETLLVLRPLSAKNANAAPVSRPDVRSEQTTLPRPPPWDTVVPGGNKPVVDSLTAPEQLAPPPKSPGTSAAGYDEPPIVLIARADVLVRVLDADNNALVDRRFQPGDSYTVPSRNGLVLVSEAPDKLDITIDGELVGPANALHPWDHIPLNAAHLAPTE